MKNPFKRRRPDVRTAILKAADVIEQTPERYDFSTCVVPFNEDCGTAHCALGWIAVFLGEGELTDACNALGYDDGMDFYHEMDRMQAAAGFPWGQPYFWTADASICAAALRTFADTHYPVPGRSTPDWNAIATRGDVFSVSNA